MILTCPQCQSQYDLPTEKLGTGGRTVRCVSCSHTWFQMPEVQKAAAPAELASTPQAPPPPPPPIPQAAASLQQDIEHVMDKDEAIFDAILSGVGTKAAGADAAKAARNELSPAVITHNPLGVGAAAFGGLTFFLCVSLTLLAVFLGQRPIVRHWPQMALLYKTMGFHLTAPGEGLRLSEIVAEQRAENQKKTLVVEGKITNMSEHSLAYPPLYVVLKNDHNLPIKEWNLKAGATRLASGETVPVMLQLPDVPEDGATIDVRVRE